MDTLLTTKDVQELLKVDRITIYRMLKDGRLTGIRVGSQWRFSQKEVQAMISFGPEKNEPDTLIVDIDESIDPTAQMLPLYCVKTLQDVFAEIAQVGSVTTDPNGIPITEISNLTPFCALMLSNKTGRARCIASWKNLAEKSKLNGNFHTCHAGLNYAAANIEIDGAFVALLITGQFYAQNPDPIEVEKRLKNIAEEYGIDLVTLTQAARLLNVLPEVTRSHIFRWLEKVAGTFGHLGQERTEMVNRLRQIAAMSSIQI